ncbi:hypothetical protein NBO_814g0001 [Nosema bombycis CQ1]|uniref:Uncharacterized protein n=1 Tax=Nosema bombycis (strain CQ1 / CVCC 102059) TaxID=578461 RepID=R0MGC5_NOSB1|nr:hypothetical protein NBO_814g0001 [Nosema bombycis CQ1]|eukprot:EOB11798.1 hypothetical protein NBO_814g0001 [Nosema bombycis CQ1]
MDVDDILNHDEIISSVSIMKDYDFFNFKERSKNPNEDENQKTLIDGFEKVNLNTRHDIVTTKYKRKVKSNIIQFIKKNGFRLLCWLLYQKINGFRRVIYWS